MVLAAAGCANQQAAASGSSAAVTESAKEEAGETSAEGSETAQAGEGTADLTAAPGSVWFDKDTGVAHGNIADTSTKGETEAEAGEEFDVNVPVKVWGTVTSVDENSLTVDNQSEVSTPGEMIVHVDPEQTVVVDAVNGLPVELSDVELGSFVAYLGPAMTMSLPPQATARVVIVNIPEDAEAPEYIVAAGGIEGTDEEKILESNDGQQYVLADDVTVEPYLTRNIVTLDDIGEGSRCLLWMDPSGDAVARIVLFAAE